MLTVALAAQKGGPGKSTIAVHLATAAAKRRKRVAVVDLDHPQLSAWRWGALRRARLGDEIDVEVVSARAQDLRGAISSARAQRADLVILDTAGRSDATAAQAMAAANVVLIPCRPSTFDLDASVETAAEVRRAKRPAFFVLSAVPRGRKRAQQARDALSALLPVAPVEIHEYTAYRDALADGRSVEELDPEGKAAEEIRALYRWVMEACRG